MKKVLLLIFIMLFCGFLAYVLYATEPKIKRIEIKREPLANAYEMPTAGTFNSEMKSYFPEFEKEIPEYYISEANYRLFVNTSSLNVRKDPSKDSEIIDVVHLNDPVNISGQLMGNDEWIQIDIGDGNKAYVAVEYLSGFQTPVEKKTTTSTEKKKKKNYVYKADGKTLNPRNGVVNGPTGKETYYNLNMNKIVSKMQARGVEGEYWVREDGVKMLGDYVMVAANLQVHPRGSIVETSLGKGIVCDTGGFAQTNPHQIDIATSW